MTDEKMLQQPTLIHITTIPLSLRFLDGQIEAMRQRGFNPIVISSPGELLYRFGAEHNIPVVGVEMRREITPIRDILVIPRLAQVFLRFKPAIVHSHTPKGGLLGMIAAWICRTPVRVYHLRGLPYVTAGGWRRFLLRNTERVSCRLAHRVICISQSLRDVVVAEGICPPSKITVLLSGSGNGVDANHRFNPVELPSGARMLTREQFGIPSEATVIGFVGRIVRDKGIAELVEAWDRLRAAYPDLHMLVVGPFEPQDPIPGEVADRLRQDERIHLAGMTEEVAKLYAAMDLLVLPTYREGFGNVSIEAAAMELPVVATRIPGCVDAVQDGVTGTLVGVRDVEALINAIQGYLDEPELRRIHGLAGRSRVLREFQQEAIWEALYQEYISLFQENGYSAPISYNNPNDLTR